MTLAKQTEEIFLEDWLGGPSLPDVVEISSFKFEERGVGVRETFIIYRYTTEVDVIGNITLSNQERSECQWDRETFSRGFGLCCCWCLVGVPSGVLSVLSLQSSIVVSTVDRWPFGTVTVEEASSLILFEDNEPVSSPSKLPLTGI